MSTPPADDAAALVKQMLKKGHTPYSVSKAAGLADGTIYRILNGDRTTVHPRTLHQLQQAATTPPLLVDAAPTVTYLRNLRSLGWSATTLASHLDTTIDWVSGLCQHDREKITYEMATKVAKFHDKHGGTPIGPAKGNAKRWGNHNAA